MSITEPRLAEPAPLTPDGDLRATVVDLLEVLLNKGAVLNIDMLIGIGSIPLIGVSLRAAIAGIETMLDYGMMRHWDEGTRRWVEASLTRDVPLEPEERVRCRMLGTCRAANGEWRPGVIFVTNARVLVLRRYPREVLFARALDDLWRVVRIEPGEGAAGEPRLRLHFSEGVSETITAERLDQLEQTIRANHRSRND
ncbi:MAG: gas vesicle protein [Vicinamibacterales bacterium]